MIAHLAEPLLVAQFLPEVFPLGEPGLNRVAIRTHDQNAFMLGVDAKHLPLRIVTGRLGKIAGITVGGECDRGSE